jgi:divalent metal cation (Fe/Co/Zn/Cd) transporter
MTNTNSNHDDDTLELPRRLTDEELDELGEAIYDAILQEDEGIHTTVDVEATEVVDNTQQPDVQ